MSNLTNRFFKRLRGELGLKIPDDAYMEITRAGRHQKSSGAFSSVVLSKSNQILEIGLYVPICDLMKCPKLVIGVLHGRYVDCGCMGVCKGVS